MSSLFIVSIMMHLLIVWSHVYAEKDAVVTRLEFVSLFHLMILCLSSVFATKPYWLLFD